MINLNGINKVNMTDIMESKEPILDSEFEKNGMRVQVFIEEKLLTETLYVITTVNGSKNKQYYPDSNIRLYAIEQKLASKNTKSLASIYHDLLK